MFRAKRTRFAVTAVALFGLAACNPAPAATPTVFQPRVTIYAPVEPTPTPAPPTRPPATAAPVATVLLPPTVAPVDGTINPFTGIKAKDAATLAQRPMLVKV
ncbi:MAG: hypothetical protein KA750_05815, partial [Thermoflexales bacterium]|nr:hypothetical protein [Thermoflexales bacterium]